MHYGNTQPCRKTDSIHNIKPFQLENNMDVIATKIKLDKKQIVEDMKTFSFSNFFILIGKINNKYSRNPSIKM